MNIVITGGAGFIGSALALRLNSSHDVTVVDAFTDYYDVSLKRKRADLLLDHGIQVKEGDVHLPWFREWCKNQKFDALFHLAALPGVPKSLEDPHRYIQEDIGMTVTVLEAVREAGIRRFYFASSSSVYGEQSGPVREQDATGDVVSPYAAAKYGAEAFCRSYQHLYGFDVTIFRFFTVYGPMGRPDMALDRFAKQALSRAPLSLFGDPVRDFTYIDDITRGMEQALEHGAVGTYNLGAGLPTRLSEIAERLAARYGLELIREGKRPGDVSLTWSDCSAAEAAFGYRPRVTINQGLEQVLSWHEQRIFA